GQNARADDPTVVDGIAQADVDVITGAEVADAREAGVDGLARVRGSEQRLLRRLAHEGLVEVEVVVVARLPGEVDVGVDEAGEERGVTEIDDFCSRRNGTADGLDA